MAEQQKRALAVAAHPDDIEFGCSGTTAKLVKEGWEVTYVIVTSGQKGHHDAKANPGDWAKLRESEARNAAAAVGVTEVVFLGYMDTEVELNNQLRKDISRQFRKYKPHRIFTMGPDILIFPWFINHPDHRNVATATLDTILAYGTTGAIFPELELEEGLPAWTGWEEVFVMGPAGGEEIVDISDTIELKKDALLSHESQNTANYWEFVKQRMADAGAERGYQYAENFRTIRRPF